MTAMNIKVNAYRAVLMTDTAFYDADGIVRGFGMKACTLPHLNCAIATRGSGLATAIFATNLGMMFDSFDRLALDGGAAAERLHAANIELLARSGELDIDMFLVGWSVSRDRPESYMLSSSDRHGFAPWTFERAPDLVGAPVPSSADLERAGLRASMLPHEFKPELDGIKLMEAQRAMRLATVTSAEDGELHYVVGGAVVLTEISRDGISQRVLHRWADEVGKPIRPDASMPAAAGLSRQQRRAMGRAGRKAA